MADSLTAAPVDFLAMIAAIQLEDAHLADEPVRAVKAPKAAKPCTRCGGSGTFHFGGRGITTFGTCFGCNGKGTRG